MKNKLTIDFDSDREIPVEITKSEEFIKDGKDTSTVKKMIIDDMITLCNGLGSLINLSKDNKFFEEEELANTCIKFFEGNFKNGKPNEEA